MLEARDVSLPSDRHVDDRERGAHLRNASEHRPVSRDKALPGKFARGRLVESIY